ncbi:MAG: hypothetical protein K9K35_02915 [Rhodoferax sp.]|jgi:hypothetical protein|nr:hypothetical protein [Rhodoferax sp.]
MDTLYQALTTAAQVWETAIDQVSWYHGLIAMAYLGAAWLCLLNGHISQVARQPHAAWYFAGIALCLLGANTVLHADLFVTHLIRAIAKLQGWYGARRALQYAVVIVLALVVLLSASWLRTVFAASEVPSETVTFGLAALLLLFALRVVSAHGTDALLNWRLTGISVGRLLELAGIGLAVHGARRSLRFH